MKTTVTRLQKKNRPFAVACVPLLCAACSRFQPEPIIEFGLGAGEGELGLSRGGYEVERVCPGPIAVAEDGTIYVLDKANERILTIDEGGARASTPLPSEATAQAIVVSPDGVFVWVKDATGEGRAARLADQTLIAVERGGTGGFGAPVDDSIDSAFNDMGYAPTISGDAAGAGGFGAPVSEVAPFAARWSRSVKTHGDLVEVEFSRSADLRTVSIVADEWTPLSITSLKPILDVSILRINPGSRTAAFLVTTDDGEAAAYVFAGDDERPRRYAVPLSSSICREQGLVAATLAGDVLFLRVTEPRAEIVRLRAESILTPLFRPSDAVDSTASEGRDRFDGVLAVQRDPSGAGGFDVETAATRDEVIAAAEAYLNLQLELTRDNFNPATGTGLGLVASCGDARNAWTRPPYISAAARNEAAGWTSLTVSRAPYAWGGFDSVFEIEAKLSSGRPVGDVCTENGVIFDPQNNPNVTLPAGVDCSGLVSRAWGLRAKLGTSGLAKTEHSMPIEWNELKPGDIINKPGKHVRLFEAWVGEARDTVQVIEAATRDCAGSVCRNTYKVGTLAQGGYRPYRANHFSSGE